MTREEALQKAREKLHQYIYLSETVVSPGLAKVYNNFSDWLGKVVYLAEVGLAALREQEERSAGCEWCGRFESDPQHLFSEGNGMYRELIYRFCPNCGLELKNKLENGERVCSRCGRKRPVACTVDGDPWCEACFEEAISVFREK